MFQFRKRVTTATSEPDQAPQAIDLASGRPGSLAAPAPALPGQVTAMDAAIDGGAVANTLGGHTLAADVPVQAPSISPAPKAAAAPTTSEDLLGEKARRMNLVGGNDLAASVDQAVRRALARHLPKLSEDLVGEVSRSTRGSLLLLLKSRSKKVRGLPKAHFLQEVEASKRKIVAEREAARHELEGMLVELGQKRVEFRQTRENLVRQTFDKGVIQDQELSEIICEALGGANATPQMAQLQRQITGLVLDSLQRERQKGVDEQTSAHTDELKRYELRIAKLTKSLEITEEELKRIAAMKNIDPGVASIYRTIQGLNAEDGNSEAKKEMLSGIFQANLALQKNAASSNAG